MSIAARYAEGYASEFLPPREGRRACGAPGGLPMITFRYGNTQYIKQTSGPGIPIIDNVVSAFSAGNV
jgi:hypothetical protein